MVTANAQAYSRRQSRHVLRSRLPVHLANNDQFLFRSVCNSKSNRTIAYDTRIALFHTALDISWYKVPSADDDQLFDPPCDVQLIVMNKPQIATAEKHRFAVGQPSTKRLIRLCRTVPITTRNSGAAQPYFPYLV